MLAAASDAEAPSPERARYLLPEGLVETVVPVASGDAKPLALRALLRKTDTPVIVFTASVEATHRLFLLLSSMDAAERKRDERDENAKPSRRAATIFAEYSSFAPPPRAPALRAFAAGGAVLIASDAATRGLDVDRVGAVISYDAPTRTDVRAQGRKDRARGPPRAAYTLCRPPRARPGNDERWRLDAARRPRGWR